LTQLWSRPRRSLRVLRLIAVLKFGKAALLLAVGLGALRLVDPAMAARAQHWAAALATSSDRQLLQRFVARAVNLPPTRLETLGIGAFLYAGLFATEGGGLWRERRWAEYLTVIATASFVPFEVFELIQRLTVLRASALAVNLAVVAYLGGVVAADRLARVNA
jgi:uncharacterized membrane protein (DUF2068 family)